MKFRELLFGHIFSAIENGAGAVVGLAHFAFLIIGEGEDAQGEDFVDLGGVEEIASAFGSDLRMVVQDDGGGKHRIRIVSGKDGPGAQVLTLGDGIFKARGRFEQGKKLSVLGAEDSVSRDERMEKDGIAAAGIVMD